MKDQKKIFKVLFSLLISVLLISAQSGSKKKTKKFSVSGTVMHTGVFCGGARMPDAMLKEIQEPKPLMKKKLFIKKGKTNDFSKTDVLEFVSDSLGNFNISLPIGEYCVIDELKNTKSNYDTILKEHEKETQYYSAVDPVCLAKWFETPDAILIVTKAGVKKFIITYNDKCSWNSIPCVSYHGPLPP